MKVVLHIEAIRELRELRDWYADRGAGDYVARLVDAIDRTIAEVARAPESFARDSKRSWARRARVVGSPYAIVFTMAAHDAVVVLAIAHGKRRARYWAKRRG